MRTTYLLLALALVSACKEQAPPSQQTKVVDTDSTGTTAPAKLDPTAPDPAPAPAAFPAADLAGLAAGTVIGYRPSTGEVAVLVTSIGDDQRRGVRSFSVVDGRPGTNPEYLVMLDGAGDVAAQVKSEEQRLVAALAGFEPIKGVPFVGDPPSAALADAKTTLRFTAKTSTLALDGRPETRKLDGGGVTTPAPRAAFHIPRYSGPIKPGAGGGPAIVVLVRYTGDVVTSDAVEVFALH